MGAEQCVSASRRNQLAVSAVFHDLRGRFHLVKDARKGNHDLTTLGYPGNVASNLCHSKPMTRILVALFILWPAAAYTLFNSPYGQLFTVTAQSIQLVQPQYIAHSSASNQQCYWSFPAIGTGDSALTAIA